MIALHKNKGMTVAACLKNRTDYIENPDKTEQGQFVSSYACSALTADEEFMLTKRQYDLVNGRRQKSDVIAYQIRQSFRPGEITAEEANKVGYELAMRFTKGKHAFVVATHTDRQHIHNHVIFNSTALDGSRKFRDFFFSALAVQRLSDLICLEHQLSVIEKKPYRERQKRIVYPPKESNRDRLCGIIDTILAEKPGDYEAFLQKLEQQGYEVKRGKHTAVKGKGQKRFIRFRTLGTGYSEDEIKAVLEGKAKHQPYQKKQAKEQPFQLLVDIQGKMAEGKSVGYKRCDKTDQRVGGFRLGPGNSLDCLCCYMVFYWETAGAGTLFGFSHLPSFRRYHRGGDHLYSDPQHAVFRTGTDCPSHRSGTDHHSICDPAVWMVWHRKNAF